MTAALVKECNQKITEISQAIAMQTGHADRAVSDRARRKVLLMVQQQISLTKESIKLHRDGITFDAWCEMFLRLNDPKFIRRVDNATGDIGKVWRVLIEKGDLEAYFNQEIAYLDKVAVDALEASLPQLEKLYEYMSQVVE